MNDKWLKIIGIPIVSVISALYFDFDTFFDGGLQWMGELANSLIITLICWEGNVAIMRKVRKHFPGFQHTAQRLRYEILGSFIFTSMLSLAMAYYFHPEWIDVFPGWRDKEFLSCFIFSLVPTAFFLAVYESRYFLAEWKKNIQQTEALARLHITSQFEALKKQLDPHFLFNSLNTLASLIHPTNEAAQNYLERLSDVYRYVLDTREKPTVTLQEELAFLEAYMYLIKVRFRDNVNILQDLSPECFQKHIPALSLQLLVENAIKHNVISKEQPLYIRIFEENDKLTVSNNKQIKQTLGHSTKVGLQNIVNRYQLLNGQPVEVVDGDQTFEVRLPFLQPALAI